MKKYVRRLAYLVLRLPMMALWPFLERLVIGRATRRVLGVDVHTVSVGESAEQATDKLAQALALIEQFDRRRFRRLQHDLSSIAVIDFFPGAIGGHIPGSRVCFLSAAHLRRRSVARTALTIVHEATHCRIDQAGIRYWPDYQARIEARCKREESSFAAQLPPAVFPEMEPWRASAEGQPARRGSYTEVSRLVLKAGDSNVQNVRGKRGPGLEIPTGFFCA